MVPGLTVTDPITAAFGSYGCTTTVSAATADFSRSVALFRNTTEVTRSSAFIVFAACTSYGAADTRCWITLVASSQRDILRPYSKGHIRRHKLFDALEEY
jgi:hypothetical protein